MNRLPSFLLLGLSFGLLGEPSRALEVTGFTGWHSQSASPKDPSFSGSGGGIGYGFSTRVDAGFGGWESGFLFSPVSLNFNVGTSEVRAGGSYWILPIIYRIPLIAPFITFGLGPDFAVRSGTSYTIQGTSLASAPASGFRSHFGAQASVQAVQEVGENLAAVLDLRYRQGIGPAISIQSTPSTLATFMISLGVQKRLD
jgi:hypothetical protein